MNEISGFKKLEKNIIDYGLCSHCGLCVGCCPENVIDFDSYMYKPKLVGTCSNCGVCFDICPGLEVNLPRLNKKLFGEMQKSYELGFYKHVYLGHANNTIIRENGSSGGIVTAILIELLRERSIDGGIVVGDDKENPWIPKPILAVNEDEFKNASQSKYVIVPSGKMLGEIKNKENKYAFVGLPCQIHGLRKIEELYPQICKNIIFLIGLYCGNQHYVESIYHFIKKFNIKDKNKIMRIRYREGKWPGKFEILLNDGKRFSVDKFTYNYITPLYIVKRCLYCIDLTNELSDISVGDGWAYRGENNGWSIIIVRTEKGVDIIKSMERKNEIYLEEISESDAIQMHYSNLDNKKIGALIRIMKRESRGKPVPKYSIPMIKISRKRIIIESFFIFVLFICSLNIVKRIIELMPLIIIDKFMRYIEYIIRRKKK